MAKAANSRLAILEQELQVEGSLDKVRALTLSMSTPSDMVGICKAIAMEMGRLGVPDIRNVQTAVFFPEKGTYMNYEYYVRSRKSLETEVRFDDHPMTLAFSEKMMKGKGRMFSETLKGKKVQDWLTFQRTTNQYADPHLAKVDVVQYHWFSLGEVAMGLTSYRVLDNAELDMFKRFRKVFEMSWRRYMDLRRAEQQAREAQIEAALERVRSATMAMKSHDEMLNVTDVLFQQLMLLGSSVEVVNFSAIGYVIGDWDLWITSPGSDSTRLTDRVFIPRFDHPIFSEAERLLNDYREKGIDHQVYTFNKEDKDKILDHVFSNTKYRETIPQEFRHLFYDRPGYTNSVVVLDETWVSYAKYTLEPYAEAELAVHKRFGKAFGQAYKRFLDLQKAEAQAREAQIEAALERVRSRSMGMQRSDELREVIKVVFDQLVGLGFQISNAGFLIDYKQSDDYKIWMADSYYETPRLMDIPYFPNPVNDDYVELKRSGNMLSSKLYSKEDKNSWLEGIWKTLDYVEKDIKDVVLEIPGLAVSTVLMEDSGLYLLNYSDEPYKDEQNAVLVRFARVFEQAYTRFRDLERVEAQAREAQIQLCLERVRSRAMGMRSSEEVTEVLQLLGQQFDVLGIFPIHVGMVHTDVVERRLTIYLARSVGPGTIAKQIISIDVMAVWQQNMAIWEQTELYGVFEMYYGLADLAKIFELFSVVIAQAPVEFRVTPDHYPDGAWEVDCKTAIGNLHIWLNRPSRDEERAILSRFAKEYDRLYQRYLDLVAIEQRAREAQIEAALERVRSRSMGMQRSDELRDVIQVIFEQLSHLIDNVHQAGFIMDYLETDDWNLWATDRMQPIPNKVHFKRFDHPLFDLFGEAKRDQLEFATALCSTEDKNRLLTEWFKYNEGVPDEIKQALFASPGYASSCVFMNSVVLYASNFDAIPLSEDANAILKRFGVVFEQAYTRFLDLQKAEAQAKEAEIQLALERIRSKSLAMRKSEEIIEIVTLLFAQMRDLRLYLQNAVVIVVPSEVEGYDTHYTANPDFFSATTFQVPRANHPFYEEAAAELKYKHFLEWNLDSQGARRFAEFLINESDYRNVPEQLKQKFLSANEYHCRIGGFSNSLIVADSWGPSDFSDMDIAVLIRFGKEFDQAYTRFLDLKKAERQAREAQIEAALEKVRGRTMGMQKSEDLEGVVKVIFEQLVLLVDHVHQAGFAMDYKASRDWDLWAMDRVQPLPSRYTFPYFDHPLFIAAEDAKAKGDDFRAVVLSKEEKDSIVLQSYRYMPDIPENIRAAMLAYPGMASSNVFLNHVVLYASNFEAIPFTDEENAILKRFGQVFEQAYTRFLDLSRAEEQARIALRQASLDRVRAEIASMRTTEDLQRITPLVWRELTTLGVPFFRCGLFIMDDAEKQVHMYLSRPDGAALAALKVPYDDTVTSREAVAHWRRQAMYTAHWDKEQFRAWVKSVMSLDQANGGYQPGQEEPESLYLQFLPFLQGMLYIGSTQPLSNEQMNLAQELASAFSVAYARYEDFNKLESAKMEVDRTLKDLRSAQSQLVQSEKMASLGELTAGIAHEIQNPLNFVNNFSEVNIELAEDLVKAIDEQDLEEAKALAGDIKGNQEKIREHGKRADGIVKSMLQHSRTSTGQKEETDLVALADEYFKLAYHGMRARDKSFNVAMEFEADPDLPKVAVVPQDIGRVVLNLINNAFQSVMERKKSGEEGYEPRVRVVVRGEMTAEAQRRGGTADNSESGIRNPEWARITVSDNGNGVPDAIRAKIFQPFFTTKPTGQGTGLGLSLSYDIVTKGHGGELLLDPGDDKGAIFTVTLPMATAL